MKVTIDMVMCEPGISVTVQNGIGVITLQDYDNEHVEIKISQKQLEELTVECLDEIAYK